MGQPEKEEPDGMLLHPFINPVLNASRELDQVLDEGKSDLIGSTLSLSLMQSRTSGSSRGFVFFWNVTVEHGFLIMVCSPVSASFWLLAGLECNKATM